MAAPPQLDACNIVFTTPSTDASGAVPLGNGSLGASVWVEPSGDLVLYLSHTDTFSEACRLLKIGKVRVHLDPAPLAPGAVFRQELKLRQGRLDIALGATTLSLLVEPDHPTLRITGSFATPTTVRVTDEGWRTVRTILNGTPTGTDFKLNYPESVAAWTLDKAPPELLVAESADVPLTAAQAPTAIGWYHRNTDSPVAATLKRQSCDALPGAFDPLLHRTFGAWLDGPGLTRTADGTLQTALPDTRLDLRVTCPVLVTKNADQWIDAARNAAQAAGTPARARLTTERHWAAFWNRSWVFAGDDATTAPLSLGYNLHRYAIACQSRGEFAPKFNGGIFTVDPVFANEQYQGCSPDFRRWGDAYWFQNTRLIYHPMLMAGDFDLMEPLWKLYARPRKLAEARSAAWYQSQGSWIPETMTLFGAYPNKDYGWDRQGKAPGEVDSPWWRWAWNQTPELIDLLLKRYEWTRDDAFARRELLPQAESLLRYFDTRFRRDDRGILVIDPTQSAETYWTGVVNDLPNIAGLHCILPRLRALPESLTTPAQRALFNRLWQACPGIPVGERDTKEGRLRVILPAWKFDDKTNNCENTEQYAIWPFAQYAVGKPDLPLAQTTYRVRHFEQPHGWGYDGNTAAMLGLTDEAARILTLKTQNSHPGYRFPATWGPNFDWLPDNDHGGNLMTTTQLMLMQCEGEIIRLLPAWPPAWNAEFKLHAPANTIVSGTVKDGRLVRLDVTPAARRKDVVVTSPFVLP